LADTLDFRVRLSRGTDFTLDAEATIPTEGVTAIVGPSGGGKTTLLRVLAGLEPAGEARVRFMGEDWLGVPTEARRIGFVFQTPALFPHLTVARNIGYGARRRDVKSTSGIVDALDLGPLMDRGVGGLSGGEARRVALGRALASNPRILFLDEPLSGLDDARKADLLPYIGRAVSEARVPALYVTHSRREIVTLADRVLGLETGRVTGWQTPPARLTARVEDVIEGQMRLRVEGAPEGEGRLGLPAIAARGERVGLGLPRDALLVSATHPGRSDARLVLPAVVVEGASGPALDVWGQRLPLPRSGPHALGTALWVSVLDVMPRPEPRDSRT
jgi:molybdate transport system ATP-binding protein